MQADGAGQASAIIPVAFSENVCRLSTGKHSMYPEHSMQTFDAAIWHIMNPNTAQAKFSLIDMNRSTVTKGEKEDLATRDWLTCQSFGLWSPGPVGSNPGL